jgi:ATP-binding cassette, subfamily B, bacterial PglK
VAERVQTPNYNPKMFETLYALIGCLSPRRRTQLALLVGLMLVGALAEVLTLGAIVPFLAVLADSEQALQSALVKNIVTTLNLNYDDIRWKLTLVFINTAIVAGVVRFALIYAIAKLNYGIGYELGREVYRRTLYQNYEIHVSRNSSEIMGGINKVDIVVGVVFSVLSASSAMLMGLFIIAGLVVIDPIVATAALLGFGGIYTAISFFTSKRLKYNSQIINFAYSARVQSLQEGLGGIRDILLDHTQSVFANRFNKIDWPLRQAQASINTIGPSPRFAVEMLGMVLIALLGYYMTASGNGITAAIPTLGALALGAQRLMPLLQQVYQGWVNFAGHRQALVDVVSLLQQPMSEDSQEQVAPLSFNHEIMLKDVSFQYQPHLPLVLKQINLTISKGERVGFIGTTGSGKSTIMDLLMGLLQPSAGQVLVDSKTLTGITRLSWQRNVAHVPQTIFLADGTFVDNIAFGVPPENVNVARVRKSAELAQIAEFIESANEGYAAMVGERGVRLSGGQRQRIGIARALYKQAKVLVFDEATSALDIDTESAVIKSIENLGLDLTVIMIAHRISTLRDCDSIYRLEEGRLAKIN